MVSRPVAIAPVVPPRATVIARPVEEVPVPKPPPPVPLVVRPSPLRQWRDRALGITTKPGQPVFPNYMEIRRRIPIPVWHAIRVVSVCALYRPVYRPVRPPGRRIVLVFQGRRAVAPDHCSSSPPGSGGTSARWRPPTRRRGCSVHPRPHSARMAAEHGLHRRHVLFFGITSARLAAFNVDGTATGILLSSTILNAFVAGLSFKGKSGWCSSICPLLPLQRVYGQTPFVTVPNSHCQPCVACTKNCYDFKPQVAYQADLHDPDPDWSAPGNCSWRHCPGSCSVFSPWSATHDSPRSSSTSGWRFICRQHRLVLRPRRLVAALGRHADSALRSVAINIFYWYASVTLADSCTPSPGSPCHGCAGRSGSWCAADLVSGCPAPLSWSGSSSRSPRRPSAHPADQGHPCWPRKRTNDRKRRQARPVEVRFQPDDKVGDGRDRD